MVNRNRKALSVRLHALLKAQEYKCAYCQEPFLRVWQVTFDHVIPKSKGGGNTVMNGLAACHPCNGKKGDRLPSKKELEYQARIIPIAISWLEYFKEFGETPYEFDNTIPLPPGTYDPRENARKKKKSKLVGNRILVDQSSYIGKLDLECFWVKQAARQKRERKQKWRAAQQAYLAKATG